MPLLIKRNIVIPRNISLAAFNQAVMSDIEFEVDRLETLRPNHTGSLHWMPFYLTAQRDFYQF